MNYHDDIEMSITELDNICDVYSCQQNFKDGLEGIASSLWELVKKLGGVIKKLIIKLLTWLGFIKKKAHDAIPVIVSEMKLSVSNAVYDIKDTAIKHDIDSFINKAEEVIQQQTWLPRFEKMTKLAKLRVDLMQKHSAINKSVSAAMDKLIENYHRGVGMYIGAGGSPKEIHTKLNLFCPAIESFIVSRTNLIDLLLEVADPKLEIGALHDDIITRKKIILERRSPNLSLNGMIKFSDAEETASYLDDNMVFSKFVLERPSKLNRILRADYENFNMMMDAAYRSAGLVEKLLDTFSQGVNRAAEALENIPADKVESITKLHNEMSIQKQDTAFPETIKSLVLNYGRLLGKEAVEIAKAGEEIRSYYLAIAQYPVKV